MNTEKFFRTRTRHDMVGDGGGARIWAFDPCARPPSKGHARTPERPEVGPIRVIMSTWLRPAFASSRTSRRARPSNGRLGSHRSMSLSIGTWNVRHQGSLGLMGRVWSSPPCCTPSRGLRGGLGCGSGGSAGAPDHERVRLTVRPVAAAGLVGADALQEAGSSAFLAVRLLVGVPGVAFSPSHRVCELEPGPGGRESVS